VIAGSLPSARAVHEKTPFHLTDFSAHLERQQRDEVSLDEVERIVI
jgi:hypothetical protein